MTARIRAWGPSTSPPTARVGDSGSAGSRRSAPCASSGVSRSRPFPASNPSFSSSRSETSSKRAKQRPLPQEMKMSRATQFLVAAVFLLGTSAAFAEDAKLGYVDMQRALNETEDGRKAKEKLKKDFEQKQKELDEKQAALKKEMEDLEKKRSLLTPDKVREKESELRGKLEQLQTTYMRLQQDLSGKEQKETAKIFERMQKIMSEIAAAENFTMIVDKSALVFAKPHLDLTNELIRRYNKGASPAAPAKPAPKK